MQTKNIHGASADRGTRPSATVQGDSIDLQNEQRSSIPNRKLRIQLVLAVVLAVFGMVLFIASFVAPPTGIIDSSVLVAGGEAFTFSGSLIGIDYSYKAKRLSNE